MAGRMRLFVSISLFLGKVLIDDSAYLLTAMTDFDISLITINFRETLFSWVFLTMNQALQLIRRSVQFTTL